MVAFLRCLWATGLGARLQGTEEVSTCPLPTAGSFGHRRKVRVQSRSEFAIPAVRVAAAGYLGVLEERSIFPRWVKNRTRRPISVLVNKLEFILGLSICTAFFGGKSWNAQMVYSNSKFITYGFQRWILSTKLRGRE